MTGRNNRRSREFLVRAVYRAPKLLVLLALVGCAPEPDTEAPWTCAACTSPELDTHVCTLDIKFSVVDHEQIVCTMPDEAHINAACQNACTTWSKEHTRACIGWSVGSQYVCSGEFVDGSGG